MRLQILSAAADVTADQWNAVAGTDYPFLRHEFVHALEANGCVGEAHGWLPRHLAAFDDDGRLTGLVPLYLKDNSYGEFVFDWAWADAYERNGLRYYPKAVVAVPYTPATGPRILTGPEHRPETAATLVALARDWAQAEGLSSLHWLFTDARDTRLLADHGYLLRLGCQFHWHNAGYRDFEDFLAGLSSRKRKKIRRERRQVAEAGIELQVVHGNEADEEQLATMHAFYRATFDRKWGHATLTEGFFRDIARDMGDQLVLVFAHLGTEAVAGAICLRSADTLYGRHWGCRADYHSLHFEACYYQGIDYCIRHGLARFEPGAQGEHKISRGFLPTPTWSAHWIADSGFRGAIGRFLEQETPAMREYIEDMSEHSPYKTSGPADHGQTALDRSGCA
ncbi:MAG TPA: N-acetyltransferase [Gammaproteobacteria bacterium]|nr:N-acetyltransferase [Gammaproteobacteria bacterium]